MSQKIEQKSLRELRDRQAELTALKANKPKEWTKEQQKELEELALAIVELEEVAEEAAKKPTYTPAKGTEKLVHLSIVRGRRFNPMTGKEESPVYTQLFTYAEWQVFKKAHRGLGYTIMAVLHDPYNEAAAFVKN